MNKQEKQQFTKLIKGFKKTFEPALAMSKDIGNIEFYDIIIDELVKDMKPFMVEISRKKFTHHFITFLKVYVETLKNKYTFLAGVMLADALAIEASNRGINLTSEMLYHWDEEQKPTKKEIELLNIMRARKGEAPLIK